MKREELIIRKQRDLIRNLKEVGQLYFKIRKGRNIATKQDVKDMAELVSIGEMLEAELKVLESLSPFPQPSATAKNKQNELNALYKDNFDVASVRGYNIDFNQKRQKLDSLSPVDKGEAMTAEEKKQYVVGYMFDEKQTGVVLIRKKKPEWQAGKLNGVGGKIEKGENPKQAMIREYAEEAGITYEGWDHFLTVEYLTCVVYHFRAFNDEYFAQSKTMEAEQIVKIDLNNFPADEVIPNLNWIVNLALDKEIKLASAVEEYSALRKVEMPRECPHNERTIFHNVSISECDECGHIVRWANYAKFYQTPQ